jgi:5-formyltetrahydrofolate cyclo-ligase
VSLALEKADLRARMQALRSAVPEQERERRSRSAADRLLALPEWAAARVAFVFRSFGSEISTLGVLDGLDARGVKLALPVLVNGVLHAGAYRLGDPLTPSRYGALEPRDATFVEPVSIDLIVAPGLAFDHHGYRLGYGGGYYDAFFKGTRPDATRIGFGFDLQVVAVVPHDGRDEPLDAVVTEERILRATR